MTDCDVVVIGAGHNGLVCACYLARSGLGVTVLEQSDSTGGCVDTVDLAGDAGRLELGAFDLGGFFASGVVTELELDSRFGLAQIPRDQTLYAPCDDGSALAFHRDLDATVEGLAAVVGGDEAARYRSFAGYSSAALRLLYLVQDGPPPSLRELVSLAETALGAAGRSFVQLLLASSSSTLWASFEDDRLRGALAHFGAHSRQPPSDLGTGSGALLVSGGHGFPAVRPAGGSGATVKALVACLEAHGGRVLTGRRVERIDIESGRVAGVIAGGERLAPRTGVVSSIDAGRVFLDLVDANAISPALRDEVRRIHSGHANVTEVKVDAVIDGPLPETAPPGFERAFMVSPNTLAELERSFAEIALGLLPSRPPLMIAFPSALEPGWAPPGRNVVWIQTYVPWRLGFAEVPGHDGGGADARPPATGDARMDERALEASPAGLLAGATLERFADKVWAVAEKALGKPLPLVERRVTGPAAWLARHGSLTANPNHVDMTIDQLLDLRPSPSLSRYATPIAGLYLSGAGTHPGGGVTGVPGRNAAQALLRDVGLRREKRSLAHTRERVALMTDAARAARSLWSPWPKTANSRRIRKGQPT